MRLPTRRQWQAYFQTEILQNTQRQAASAMGISQPMVSQHLAVVMVKLPVLAPDSAKNITMTNFISYDTGMDYDVKHRF